MEELPQGQKKLRKQPSLVSLEQGQREHIRAYERSRSNREIMVSSNSDSKEDSLVRVDQNIQSPGRSQAASQFAERRERFNSYALLATDDSVECFTEEDNTDFLIKYGAFILNSWCFQGLVALLIITNAMVIGFETDKPDMVQWDVIEQVLLAFFSAELLLRFYVLGTARFFDFYTTDFVWNVFDCVVVGIGVLDFLTEVGFKSIHIVSAGAPMLIRMVRLLRILRLFRLIRFLKRLYILAYGFSLAGVAVFWVACLMTGVLYFCAIILVRTMGRLPEGDTDRQFFGDRFGTIGQAMFSLFQLAVQPNLLEYQAQTANRPFLLCFLVVFVIFGSFGMIALLTGVISEAMFEKNIMRLEDERREKEFKRRSMVKACTEMFDKVIINSNECPVEELFQLIPEICSFFEVNNVPYTRHDLHTMIELMDTDGSGAINRAEFCRGILQVAEEVRPMLIMELHYDSLAYFRGRMDTCMEQMQHEHEEIRLFRDAVNDGFRDLRRRINEVSGAATRYDSGNFEEKDGSAHVQPTYSGGGHQLQEFLKPLTAELRELQGAIFALSGRMEELVGDSHAAKVASQLEELRLRRRFDDRLSSEQAASAGAPEGLPAPGPGLSPLSDVPGGEAGVAAELRLMRTEFQSLQGGLFSLSGRMEEVVSDSTTERLHTTLQELATLRQRTESDAHLAQRIGQCEFAVLQASGAIRQLGDRSRELSLQVDAALHHLEDGQNKSSDTSTRAPPTPATLSRSPSLTTTVSNQDHLAPTGVRAGLSRSGSRDSRQGQQGQALLHSSSAGMMPALSEGSHGPMETKNSRPSVSKNSTVPG